MPTVMELPTGKQTFTMSCCGLYLCLNWYFRETKLKKSHAIGPVNSSDSVETISFG